MVTSLIAWSVLNGESDSVTISPNEAGVSVSINPTSGDYVIKTLHPQWTFGGSFNQKVRIHLSSHESDEFDTYSEIGVTFGSRRSAVIRLYDHYPVVRFFDTRAPQTFPTLTTFPAHLHGFSHRDSVFSPPSFTLEKTSTPWLLFDDQKNAFILSPASDFMFARMAGDDQIGLQSGLGKAGFKGAHQSLLVVDPGIGKCWRDWGAALRAPFHRERPVKEADPVLSKYGYWTDNGADYYYNYGPLGYADTLLEVARSYKEKGIPLGYMQLDSWWYDKSIDGPDGKPGGHIKNPNLPEMPWNRYGGLMNYEADPYLFPDGLAGFQKKLGLPLVTHNRWVDRNSPYVAKFGVNGVAITNPEWWRQIATYLKAGGVICYEQDWLSEIYANSPDLVDPKVQGSPFTDVMASECAKQGLSVQYCMATPRFTLQAVEYPNLATIRPSDDRFDRGKWASFLFNSQLDWEVGAYPWCDVFKSGETENMLLACLSNGPVGTGDALGKEVVTNIKMAAKPDGTLVQPDCPIVPTDDTYLQRANGEKKPFQAWTYTQNGNVKTTYLVAFARKDDAMTVTFDRSSLALNGEFAVYQPFTGQVSALSSSQELQVRLKWGGFGFYEVAPLGLSGIALFGDKSKFVGTGRQRISSLIDSPSGLAVNVAFTPREGPVTLAGYAESKPSASIGDEILDVTYNRQTRLFTVVVPNREGAVLIKR